MPWAQAAFACVRTDVSEAGSGDLVCRLQGAIEGLIEIQDLEFRLRRLS